MILFLYKTTICLFTRFNIHTKQQHSSHPQISSDRRYHKHFDYNHISKNESKFTSGRHNSFENISQDTSGYNQQSPNVSQMSDKIYRYNKRLNTNQWYLGKK